jgi:histidine triad (HIT) family protein
MKNCIFCLIVAREVPAKIIHESNLSIAFNDINPAAPNHVLVVPKIHLANINDLSESNAHYVSDMMLLAKKMAHECSVDSSGYRLVINNEADAQQSVFHLHMHLLGGRQFSWPPG